MKGKWHCVWMKSKEEVWEDGVRGQWEKDNSGGYFISNIIDLEMD